MLVVSAPWPQKSKTTLIRASALAIPTLIFNLKKISRKTKKLHWWGSCKVGRPCQALNTAWQRTTFNVFSLSASGSLSVGGVLLRTNGLTRPLMFNVYFCDFNL